MESEFYFLFCFVLFCFRYLISMHQYQCWKLRCFIPLKLTSNIHMSISKKEKKRPSEFTFCHVIILYLFCSIIAIVHFVKWQEGRFKMLREMKEIPQGLVFSPSPSFWWGMSLAFCASFTYQCLKIARTGRVHSSLSRSRMTLHVLQWPSIWLVLAVILASHQLQNYFSY